MAAFVLKWGQRVFGWLAFVAVVVNVATLVLCFPMNVAFDNGLGAKICDDEFIAYGPDTDWGQDEYF